MTWGLTLTIFLIGLLFLMVLGMPIAFAFLLVNLFTSVLLFGFDAGPNQLVLSMYRSVSSFALVPIPLFVLMGEILYHSGLAFRTLDALSKWLGRLPGRLSVLSVGAGTVFAALSGSAIANTAMLGSLLVPQMMERGYSKQMSVGPILAAGGLAMLIPPSAMAVLVGTIGEISIGKLLVGGIIPGLIMAVAGIAYIIIRCLINPKMAPPYEVAAVSWNDRMVVLCRDIMPLGILVFLVVGVIFLGWATPTEAAALGATGSYGLIAAYGLLNRDVLKKSLLGTVKVSGMILLIMAGSAGFSQLLAFTGATQALIQSVLDLGLAPLLIIVAMQILVMIMGMFLEQISILMITMPLFMPVVAVLGFDPVWFGLLMLVNLDLANITPPFGLTLFVMKGVTPPSVQLKDIYKSAMPFVIIDSAVLALLLLFPQMGLWLTTVVK